jgi:hypothetical protein
MVHHIIGVIAIMHGGLLLVVVLVVYGEMIWSIASSRAR